GLARAEPPLALHPLGERAPAHELHPEAHAAVVRVRPEDRHDVGMADAREKPRLMEHARLESGAAAMLAPEQLQRDLPLQGRIPRAMDLPEASFAQTL